MPDGHGIVVGDREGYVYRWDIKSGKKYWKTYPYGIYHFDIAGLAVSPDGKWISILGGEGAEAFPSLSRSLMRKTGM